MQILTLGHAPEKTYVFTEPEDSVTPTMISIPSGVVPNGFLNMITTKMQPLWAPRNEFRVDKGTSVELSDDEVSAVRVGELRVTAGQGAGKTRGVVIELTMREDEDDEGAGDAVAREITLRDALDAIFRESSVKMSNAKLVSRLASKLKEEPEHAELARLYANLMRVAAPTNQR